MVKIGGLNYFIDANCVIEFKLSDYKGKMAKAKRETEKARRVLKQFNRLYVLVCHQPPYRVLDKVTEEFAPRHRQ